MSAVRDRRLRLALGTWASAAFAVLWIGAAVNVVGDGRLAPDAWRWVTDLAAVPQLVAWVVLLPATVALWASQSDLPAVLGWVVAAGLVVWTVVAWAGLARALLAGRRAR